MRSLRRTTAKETSDERETEDDVLENATKCHKIVKVGGNIKTSKFSEKKIYKSK